MRKLLQSFIKRSLLLSSLVVVSVGLTVSAQSAGGGIGGRPARPDANNPRSQSIFINALNRGETVEDATMVSNNSDTVRTIEIYAVDGVASNDGAYTCREKAEPVVASGKWIELSKNEVVLEPGAREEVTFTVTVPENADVGEHNACLMFADPDETGEDKGGVRLHTRQGIRVVTTIPGDLHRELSLNSFSAEDKGNQQNFSLELQNRGNVSADTNIKLSLTSFFGKIAYDNGGVFPVLPNERLRLSFSNEDSPFWGGWYKAKVEVEYNTNAKLLGFDESADKAAMLQASQDIFIMPNISALIIMGAGLLIVLSIIIVLIVRGVIKRRRRRLWVEYEVAEGDTIMSLAEECGVKWKLLRQTNKLSAPYSLTPGQIIKIPAGTKSNTRLSSASDLASVKDSELKSQKQPKVVETDARDDVDDAVEDILKELGATKKSTTKAKKTKVVKAKTTKKSKK